MPQIKVANLRVQDVVDVLSSMESLAFLDKSVFEAIGEELMIIHKNRFKAQVDPMGKPWQELNEKYQAKKREDATYQKILQYSGKLVDMLHAQATDYGVKFGSNEVYAATHHYGRDGIPARPFIGINAGQDTKAIQDKIKSAYEIWLAKNS